ncbi:MAG: hypothetical protein J6R67_00445 [Treponema sp.]|jgi:hypothetical protein|nr:hypothetical protein [Treponema sp.]
MSATEENPMVLILSILERGKGKSYMEMLTQRDIHFHTQTMGFGTAPSEMMDILGLGSNDKDVILSLAPKQEVTALTTILRGNLGSSRYRGLMMELKLSAINRLTAEMIVRTTPEKQIQKGEDEEEMRNEYHHQLILISVNQGCTDEVMHTARGAGAMGGTIIRSRLAETGIMSQFGIQDVMAEREIIMILAASNIATKIMDAVNKAHGVRSDANGIVCALPVERAFKV